MGSVSSGDLGYAKLNTEFTFNDNEAGPIKQDLVVEIADLQYTPIYDATEEINTVQYTAENFQQLVVRRGLKNIIDTDNSIIRWDTNINIRDWSGGGQAKYTPNQEILDQYKQFGKNGIPFIEEAYKPTVENYSMAPPKGLPSFSDTLINYTGDPAHGAFFIPTIVGSADEVKTLQQGCTAPPGTEERFAEGHLFNIQTIPNGYPNGGQPIFTFYYYDREKFYTMLANGGWNYTNFPDDFVPHKL